MGWERFFEQAGGQPPSQTGIILRELQGTLLIIRTSWGTVGREWGSGREGAAPRPGTQLPSPRETSAGLRNAALRDTLPSASRCLLWAGGPRSGASEPAGGDLPPGPAASL